MKLKSFLTLIICFLFYTSIQSSNARNFPLQIKNGIISYSQDESENRLLDFSFCGYKSSEQDIPNVENSIFVPLQTDDATDIIQRAINYVSQLKPNNKGFRGAVLLDKGVYNLSKSLWIKTSGVVLRGFDKTETVLFRHGFDRSAILHIEGTENQSVVDSFLSVSNYIPVNQKNIELSTVKNLKIGDKIKIIRSSTKEWISSLGCDEFGGGISALGWKPGDIDICWIRVVRDMNGNVITLDAPLTMALDEKYGELKIVQYNGSGLISESGVENLTMISDYNKNYPKDEDHCWTGVSIENAENCWVRQLDFKHLAGSAVILQPNSTKITVEDCISTEPISEIAGLRRMTFYNLGQQNLFQRCYSEDGINDFAVGYCAPGPNAFVQCEAKRALGFSGAVSSWSCGLLYDVVNIDGNNLTFKNLGQSKNGAGWGTANSLFWQCSAAEIECYSPSTDAKNYAYGCWAQFSGDGEWAESNNHVQPRSLYYAQLAARLNQNVENRGRILPKNTDATSSPTIEQAFEMASAAHVPLLTLREWITKADLKGSVDHTGLMTTKELKSKPMKIKAKPREIGVVNGRLVCDGKLIAGDKLDVQWWNGKLKPKYIASPMTKPHITRFVPGREGYGLTDRIDSVISYFKANNTVVMDHNYGLWTDRRRDDHERIRRRDGDVWAPFYEQPFARSGDGTAWDGLSKYDLNRPNEWYWSRLRDFAFKSQNSGILLFHENFFQHNIIEAGAHWVDCPWRSANNINNLDFPEPVPFAGDKRIFMADFFYDISNPARKEFYRNYIRQGLNNFAGTSNVVQLISAEYTGPLHFVQFWLDVIDEWQKETGQNALVALSTTKDVQDSILNDPKRAAVVDIIDIRYWHYKNDGSVYAPQGGLSLAPRQHARLMKVGKVTFDEAYKAVNEYRTKYPDKAVNYYAQNYPDMVWAVLMAGGSCPDLKTDDQEFLIDVAKMQVHEVKNDNYKMLVKSDTGIIIYAQSNQKIPVKLSRGKYILKFIDSNSGITKILERSIKGMRIYNLQPIVGVSGVYWFQKQ
ncbi:MAG: DUF6298 domain-containing protein [Paludibacter sp.]|nr:DUF6298 domain-containing protein [Paludibacter sp.]